MPIGGRVSAFSPGISRTADAAVPAKLKIFMTCSGQALAMDYYSILNLDSEPFSNSPDPEYFYHSRQHLDCLQKLELSLHLRRGLNVIIGAVGTGKTTLCRQLIRKFAQRKEMETHLILDPTFKDAGDFLGTVAAQLSGKKPQEGTTDWQTKEFIKHSLFRKGVDQKKTTVLIIDEGQKIPLFCLELLREFLNYETNESKLLQIVIFAQNEFESILQAHPNFADRINLYHQLKPLSFRDTRMMIRFRLEKSSQAPQKLNFFTLPATWSIYRTSGGYPRKIINLCHQCILSMIIQNKSRVGYRIVQQCGARIFLLPGRAWGRAVMSVLAGGILAAALLGYFVGQDHLPWASHAPAPRIQEAVTQPIAPAATAPAPPEASNPPAKLPPEADHPPAPAASATDTAAALTAPPASSRMPKPAPQPPAPLQEPPQLLGSLTIRFNETLSGLTHRVYGKYSSRHVEDITRINPQIVDPDRVEAGQVIRFPALAAGVTPLNKPVWWVKIGEAHSLEEAVNILRDYPESAPPARLIPIWQPGVGNRFVLILRQVFSSPETAEPQMSLLPPSMVPASRLLDAWGERTVFFSDPYAVK
jgi:general secretion pathway protein A